MSVYGVQSINYNPKSPVGAAPTASDPQAQEMDFLQLLISQITNQTPDSPMDPTAMITQYSQMQAAIGLIKLNAASSVYQNTAIAASLMNQKVTIRPDAGAGVDPSAVPFISGEVTAVDYAGDNPRVKVNGDYYSLANVVRIGE